MSHRLVSLDVFRGLTIALMILVNNPGSWSHVYPPLLHAKWHGCTPTDLVFPFFLFIVGVSIVFALSKQKSSGKPVSQIIRKIVSRSIVLFLLGIFLSGFPFWGAGDLPSGRKALFLTLEGLVIVAFMTWQIIIQTPRLREAYKQTGKIAGILAGIFLVAFLIVGFPDFDLSHLRIPGVLQRIAFVYLASSLIFLFTNWRIQLVILTGILIFYWVLMALVPVPGIGPANLEPETNLGAWLDNLLLEGHLWSQSKVWDPEGLLSTLPAIGSGLLGVLIGQWIRTDYKPAEKVVWLFIDGSICILIGLAWDMVFPINKALWTSSYVMYTGGLAMHVLAFCYWFIDVEQKRAWTPPAIAYGMNAITVFVLSGVVGRLLYLIKVGSPDGEATTLKTIIMDQLFNSWLSPVNASLLYAISMITLLLIPIWIMYRQKIIIKV